MGIGATQSGFLRGCCANEGHRELFRGGMCNTYYFDRSNHWQSLETSSRISATKQKSNVKVNVEYGLYNRNHWRGAPQRQQPASERTPLTTPPHKSEDLRGPRDVRSGPSHRFLRPAVAKLVSGGRPPASHERGSSCLSEATADRIAAHPLYRNVFPEIMCQSHMNGWIKRSGRSPFCYAMK